MPNVGAWTIIGSFTFGIVSWNAILGGYVMHGYANRSCWTFPADVWRICRDNITFVSLLSTCSCAALACILYIIYSVFCNSVTLCLNGGSSGSCWSSGWCRIWWECNVKWIIDLEADWEHERWDELADLVELHLPHWLSQLSLWSFSSVLKLFFHFSSHHLVKAWISDLGFAAALSSMSCLRNLPEISSWFLIQNHGPGQVTALQQDVWLVSWCKAGETVLNNIAEDDVVLNKNWRA